MCCWPAAIDAKRWPLLFRNLCLSAHGCARAQYRSCPPKIIDSRLMQAQRVIALAKRGNKMSVAISDPTNTQALDQIKFQTESTGTGHRCARRPAATAGALNKITNRH
jgi:hypothetical protein